MLTDIGNEYCVAAQLGNAGNNNFACACRTVFGGTGYTVAPLFPLGFFAVGKRQTVEKSAEFRRIGNNGAGGKHVFAK